MTLKFDKNKISTFQYFEIFIQSNAKDEAFFRFQFFNCCSINIKNFKTWLLREDLYLNCANYLLFWQVQTSPIKKIYIYIPRLKSNEMINAIKFTQEHKVNLLHIESRSSLRQHDGYEFMVECAPGGNLGGAIEAIRAQCGYFSIISRLNG